MEVLVLKNGVRGSRTSGESDHAVPDKPNEREPDSVLRARDEVP